MQFMRSDNPNQLRNAVERMLNCKAHLAQCESVLETFGGKRIWEGVVHVFDLTGHPNATRAYAWSSSIKGSDETRFCAVLHQPPVTSPLKAVRAAFVLEHWEIEQ
jgi:hypothetical protein